MASQGGLTRRRGAGGGASQNVADEDGPSSRVTSPTPKSSSAAFESRAPETSFSAGENGHKIAFDPRDISESEERSKQPKLTLMEEVLLLGLKDKQVGGSLRSGQLIISSGRLTVGDRATCHFGTIISPTLSEAASSSNWLSVVA